MSTPTVFPSNFSISSSPQKIIFKIGTTENENLLISENIEFKFMFHVCSYLDSPKKINSLIFLTLRDSDFFSFENGEQIIEIIKPLTVGKIYEEIIEVTYSVRIKNVMPLFEDLTNMFIRFNAVLQIENFKLNKNSYHDFELIKTISV